MSISPLPTALIQQGDRLTDDVAAQTWKRYPEYRESGIEGFGALPTHWQTKPLKRVVEINPEELPNSTDPDYEVEYVDIGNVSLAEGITSTENYRFENSPSRARRRVRNGDTIISTVRTYLKAVAQIANPPENLIASTGFAVLRPHCEIDPTYLYRLVQSEEFVGRVVAHSTGVSYPAIAPTLLGRLDVCVPPLPEQQSIAAFLDRKTRQIDGLIEKKQQLITLLEEKRTALISHAITKGLNPDAPMRPSCIDGLGDIPADWEVKRLRHISPRLSVGLVINPSTYVDDAGTVPFLFGSNVREFKINSADARRITDESNRQLAPSRLCTGDVVVVRVGAPGVSAVIPPELSDSNCASMMIVRRDISFDSRWLCYVLNSAWGKFQVDRVAYGAAQKQFNISHAVNFEYPVPGIDEQREIAVRLDAQGMRLEALVERIESVIIRLTEYRQAIVSAAVAGKIDVRQEVEA